MTRKHPSPTQRLLINLLEYVMPCSVHRSVRAWLDAGLEASDGTARLKSPGLTSVSRDVPYPGPKRPTSMRSCSVSLASIRPMPRSLPMQARVETSR